MNMTIRRLFISDKDVEFMDDSELQENEDVNFYRKIDKKIVLQGDETPIPMLKRDVGRLRIESDSSSSEYEEEEEQIGIPNYDPDNSDEDEATIPERMLAVYGTDNYEWNYYKKSKGSVCEFRGDSSYLSSFLYSLYAPTKNNKEIKKILPMVKNYVGELTPSTLKIINDPSKNEDHSGKIKQAKNCLYLTLLYGLRHAATGIYYHTTDFSCLDEDFLKELKVIENQILHDRRSILLINKYHLTNDILINYGYFIKVYTIQTKFWYLNIGDQQKVKMRQELTSCVHSQFNGMYTIRAMFQDAVRKNYKPVYIFIDCSVSLKHFDNFYFSIDP